METSSNLISVAIPTFNSSKYLEDCLKSLSYISIVDEIIISDDCSNDDEFAIIKNIIRGYENNFEIKVFRNKKNIGAFKNKFENIKRCKNDIVYQIDSDNIACKNLSKVIDYILKENNNNFLYLPSKIYQFRKYPKTVKFLSLFNKKFQVTYTNTNFIFSKEVIKNAISKNFKVTVDKNINWVLNSGNFIVHKSKYINLFEKLVTEDIRYPMDAVAISYYWLLNGGELKTLKAFKHYHRKRYDSVSFIESQGSYESLMRFREKLLQIN